MRLGRSVRIGVDLYAYQPVSTDGVSTFSIGLLEGLLANADAGDLVLLVSNLNKEFFLKKFGARGVRLYCVPTHSLARYLNRIFWILSWLTHEYRIRFWYERWFRKSLNRKIDAEIDALIVPTTVFNFYALGVPTILCVHDIQHEFHPENFTRHQRVLRWASYRLSCARASVIQVSSLYIQSCLLEKFTFLSAEKFLIAPEGVDGYRFAPNADDKAPNALPESMQSGFVFYPAQMWKHKNHLLLLQALATFRDRVGSEMPCVLTGHDYGYWGEVENLRARLGLHSVCYLGRVEFAELIWLYKHCEAVLALGMHESSSLPVREGASFGKPLICANIPPNIEAAEYLHLNLFQHNNPADLVELLIHLKKSASEIQGVAIQNIERVAVLRWHVIARLYIDCLSTCISVNRKIKQLSNKVK